MGQRLLVSLGVFWRYYEVIQGFLYGKGWRPLVGRLLIKMAIALQNVNIIDYWKYWGASAFGRWIFSWLVSFFSPYTGSLHFRIQQLDTSKCEALMVIFSSCNKCSILPYLLRIPLIALMQPP
jgi:hypothetical protein